MEFKDTKEDTWFETRALVDCGSQGSCINEKESQNYLTSHTSKPNPTKMIMADGNFSSAGLIMYYDPVQLRIGGSEEPYALDIAPLSHEIILGAPWLRRHSPRIDFCLSKITFNSEYCQHCCGHYGRTLALHPDPKPIRPMTETPTMPTECHQAADPHDLEECGQAADSATPEECDQAANSTTTEECDQVVDSDDPKKPGQAASPKIRWKPVCKVPGRAKMKRRKARTAPQESRTTTGTSTTQGTQGGHHQCSGLRADL